VEGCMRGLLAWRWSRSIDTKSFCHVALSQRIELARTLIMARNMLAYSTQTAALPPSQNASNNGISHDTHEYPDYRYFALSHRFLR
jgi:hypothetical protein